VSGARRVNAPAAAARDDAPARPTPPWLFFFLDLQFGAAVGYLSIAVPYWMEARGLGIGEIAVAVGWANSVHAWKILWIPLLDLGPFRKLWYLGGAAGTAGTFVVLALLPDPMRDLPLLATLLALLQATAATAHAANNTLMATTTRPEDKGKVGGFAQASNVGGTGLLAALAIVVADRASPRAAALTLAAVVVASASLAVVIVERRHLPDAVARARGALATAAARLGAMARDLWTTVRSREGFTGLVYCLAPVGCQAMSNLFSGVSRQYGAGPELVALVTGLGGGALADRMNRRLAYALSGALTAVTAIAMAAAPMTPATYAWGTLAYQLAGGIAFASWTGMVLELVGLSTAAATKYALFNASLSFAISYVTWADGALGERLAAALGLPTARGALAVDAGLTFVGVALLLALAAATRARAPAT
jgi:MFS transporter, PAT family, beta-lactamase induction signal transducer AmpG